MKTLLRCRERLILSLALAGMLFVAGVAGAKAVVAQEEEQAPCPKPYINRCVPAAAQVGAEVEIKGNRFGSVQGVVSFAPGVDAKIVTWGQKRIAVTVPDGTQSGSVMIVLPCGEKSNPHHFTVVASEQE